MNVGFVHVEKKTKQNKKLGNFGEMFEPQEETVQIQNLTHLPPSKFGNFTMCHEFISV